MKKLILLFTIILYSCNQKNEEIEKMEIMSYYHFPKNNIVYSFVSNNRTAKTSFNSEPESDSETKINCFETKIEKKLFDSIIEITRNAKDEDFKFKSDKNIWYCGPRFRFKIKYKNGNEFNTIYAYVNKENIKFKTFQNLYSQLLKDSVNEKKINLNESKELEINRKIFIKNSTKLDSILNSKYIKEYKLK